MILGEALQKIKEKTALAVRAAAAPGTGELPEAEPWNPNVAGALVATEPCPFFSNGIDN
jgi:hypothetical protein